MAQFLLLCMIIADALVVLAMATEKAAQTWVRPNRAFFSKTLATSPVQYTAQAQAPRIRLGNHHPEVIKSSGAPAFSPSEAPQVEECVQSMEVDSSDETAVIEPKNEEDDGAVQGHEILLRKHHSIDKSVAGGGVILGGLATTFLVTVFCYIRATGRKNDEITA